MKKIISCLAALAMLTAAVIPAGSVFAADDAPVVTAEAPAATALDPATFLFKGYVSTTSGGNLKFRSDSTSDAEVIGSIPNKTLLDIYSCAAEGWYMTEYDGQIGFVSSKFIVEKKVPVIDETKFLFNGHVETASGGNLNFRSEASSSSEAIGSIPNGTKLKIYSCDTEGWYMTIYEDNIGYVSAKSIKEDAPDTPAEPNEYGFYEIKDYPAAGVSVAALSGTWKEADKEDTLVIEAGTDIYNGTFTAGETKGIIKIEYTLSADNVQEFWYTFYTNDGKLWNSFAVTGDIPLVTLKGKDKTFNLVEEVPVNIAYGDANCDGEVNLSDAVLIMQHLANPEKYIITEQGKINADCVGGDGLTSMDALGIQMIEAGTFASTELPVTVDYLNSFQK